MCFSTWNPLFFFGLSLLRLYNMGDSNLVVAINPESKRVLHYEEQPAGGAHHGPGDSHHAAPPPMSLDASLFSDHTNVQLRSDWQGPSSANRHD